jgi:zinc/manganese transport system substrate-binding protein
MEHLESLLSANPARFILQDVYNPDDASKHLADKLGMKVVVMPHDVGSVREATGIVALFDELVRRVTE